MVAISIGLLPPSYKYDHITRLFSVCRGQLFQWLSTTPSDMSLQVAAIPTVSNTPLIRNTMCSWNCFCLKVTAILSPLYHPSYMNVHKTFYCLQREDIPTAVHIHMIMFLQVAAIYSGSTFTLPIYYWETSFCLQVAAIPAVLPHPHRSRLFGRCLDTTRKRSSGGPREMTTIPWSTTSHGALRQYQLLIWKMAFCPMVWMAVICPETLTGGHNLWKIYQIGLFETVT